MGTLPNVIIIGSPKCGTSSLHYYLGLHPEIFMSVEKELNFFIEEKNWTRGIEWYQAQFEADRAVSVRGEASPGYTHFPLFRGVPQRMHSLLPQARLIQLVRDPMKRLISHYFHERRLDRGTVLNDINEEVRRFDDSFIVMPSRQCMQLELYLQYYRREQVLILTQDELARDRSGTLRRVFQFLGVDDSFDSPEFSKMLNVGDAETTTLPGRTMMKAIQQTRVGRRLPAMIKSPIRKALLWPFSRPVEAPLLEPALEQYLLDIFRDDVERLRRVTGMKFEDWCV